jgi:hypothetical protein
MAGFERGDIVLDHAREPHDFEGVGSQRFLVMIPQRDEKKESGEERYDDDSDGGSGEQFEMKMFWAEKPGDAPA